jgi:tetratricopeptide (TPR) repeat protein
VTIDPDLMALVQHFFDLRDVEPNYAIAYVNAGQDRLYKGFVEPAIEFYEKALRRTPDEETALTSLLFAQTIQADRPAVTRNAVRALELYPGSGPVRNTAMDARWRTGQPLEALVTELAAARSTVKPEDRYQVDMAIGNAWWNLGQADKALAAYDSVLAYQSDSPEGLWGRGAALALAERWDESIEYYGKAVRLRTGVVSLRCDFARDLIRAGRVAEAQKHLDEAKILEAENAPAEALRGWAALAQGDLDAALAHARQAREWGPWCDLARIIEARALKARGDLSGADQAVAPIRERLAAGTPPGYIYLPKQATWQSIHELPAVERMLIADITRP